MSARLFIVEDEPELAALVADYARVAGYAPTVFGDGAEALAAIRAEAPALVVLDLMLPGLDGLAVCRAVRAFSEVPIVMVTALVEEIDRLLGLEAGADDYLCKPFSPRELMARIKAILRRAGNATPVRPISVDEAGQVFSRAQLLDLASQDSLEVNDRAVDSHIKNLRRKRPRRCQTPKRSIRSTAWDTGSTCSIPTFSPQSGGTLRSLACDEADQPNHGGDTMKFLSLLLLAMLSSAAGATPTGTYHTTCKSSNASKCLPPPAAPAPPPAHAACAGKRAGTALTYFIGKDETMAVDANAKAARWCSSSIRIRVMTDMPMIRPGLVGRVIIALAAVLALQACAQAGVVRDHPGHWLGELKIPDGRTLKVGPELFIRADGSPWASFASPDQDAYDVPIKSMREAADSVELDLSFASGGQRESRRHRRRAANGGQPAGGNGNPAFAHLPVADGKDRRSGGIWRDRGDAGAGGAAAHRRVRPQAALISLDIGK